MPARTTPITIAYVGSFDMTNTAVPQKAPSSYTYHVEWSYAWTGTWGGLFADPSTFTSGQRPFSKSSIVGETRVTYRSRSDGPLMSCTLRIVGDRNNPPSFFASYDTSAGTLAVQVGAPTFRNSNLDPAPDPACVGGPGVNVFGEPADFNPLGGGGTVDIDRGGTVRLDRSWKWTYVFPADLDKARRDYTAKLRTDLTVGGGGCIAPAACEPRVSSLTYVRRVWDNEVIGDAFANGSPLVADRRDLPPLRVDAAPPVGCSDDRLAVWLDCDGDGMQEKSWPVAFVRGTTPPLAEVRFRQPRDCRRLGVLTVVGRSTLPTGSAVTFERSGVKPKGCGEIRVRALRTRGTVPDDVRTWRLRIEWTLIERNGKRHPAGTTDTPAYTLLRAPKGEYVYRPEVSARIVVGLRPFLSLVDLVATEAEGAVTQAELLERTFRAFRRLDVRPRTLVVAKGDVRRDAPMFYWSRTDPWTIEKFVTGTYDAPARASCSFEATALLLTKGVSSGGRCGSWGPLFASLLALQGIQAVTERLPVEGAAWTAIAPPKAKGCEGVRFRKDCYMLIKPWRFAATAKAPVPLSPGGEREGDPRARPDHVVRPAEGGPVQRPGPAAVATGALPVRRSRDRAGREPHLRSLVRDRLRLDRRMGAWVAGRLGHEDMPRGGQDMYARGLAPRPVARVHQRLTVNASVFRELDLARGRSRPRSLVGARRGWGSDHASSGRRASRGWPRSPGQGSTSRISCSPGSSGSNPPGGAEELRGVLDLAARVGARFVYGPSGGAPALEWEAAAEAFAQAVAPAVEAARGRGVSPPRRADDLARRRPQHPVHAGGHGRARRRGRASACVSTSSTAGTSAAFAKRSAERATRSGSCS